MSQSPTVATSLRPATELNERAIKAAQPGDVLRDANVSGLHLRVFPTKRTFYLYYRTKTGQERRPKLGDYGSITLTQARSIAQQMLADVALGGDPVGSRKAARAEPTVAELWAEFWKRHASGKKSAAEDQRLWNKVLEPLFGKKRLSEVAYGQVANMMSAMSETPVQANRALALLSSVFNFGIAPLEWASKNPCKGVKRFAETKRKRYATREEIAALSAALARRKADCPESVAFIYLLILTGARCGELASARWEWLDGNVLRLPDSKTGARNIYLPEMAADIINTLPRTSGTILGIQSPRKVYEAARKEAGCPDLRLHDLRHSFASIALSDGKQLDLVAELLGHNSTQTTKRYAHLMEEAAALAAAEIGKCIARMLRS